VVFFLAETEPIAVAGYQKDTKEAQARDPLEWPVSVAITLQQIPLLGGTYRRCSCDVTTSTTPRPKQRASAGQHEHCYDCRATRLHRRGRPEGHKKEHARSCQRDGYQPPRLHTRPKTEDRQKCMLNTARSRATIPASRPLPTPPSLSHKAHSRRPPPSWRSGEVTPPPPRRRPSSPTPTPHPWPPPHPAPLHKRQKRRPPRGDRTGGGHCRRLPRGRPLRRRRRTARRPRILPPATKGSDGAPHRGGQAGG